MATWWQEFFLSGDYRELEQIPVEKTEEQVGFIVDKLGLQPGERLLDVACGIGRHSIPLAERGVRVTGLDYTPAYLARAAARSGALPAGFVRGDMRRIPFAGSTFDAAINLFTSFGYFDSDEEDAGVFREIARVLRPGGRLLLDTVHRDGIAHHFQERDWAETAGGFLLQSRSWDSRTGRSPSTWVFLRSGEQHTHTISIRMYTCPEIERMLGSSGLEVTDVWGSWQGEPLGLTSMRLIVAATKAG